MKKELNTGVTETIETIYCDCGLIDHQTTFVYFSDEHDQVYLTTHLTGAGFLYRLKYAIKYIFGFKSNFGCFDEIVISNSEYNLNILKNVVKHLENK